MPINNLILFVLFLPGDFVVIMGVVISVTGALVTDVFEVESEKEVLFLTLLNRLQSIEISMNA